MFPLLGSLISGGASLLGNMFSSNNTAQTNATNIRMQEETNAMTVAENQKNRDFQTQMSNTAYQRASSDMQQAGLNPAMMFGSGSAASTPSGGVPSLTAPKAQPNQSWSDMGRQIGQAIDAGTHIKYQDKMAEEIANLQATKDRIIAETGLTKVQTGIGHSQAEVAANAARTAQSLKSMPDWLRTSLDIGAFSGQKMEDVWGGLLPAGKLIRGITGNSAKSGARFTPEASEKSARDMLMYPDNPTKPFSPSQRQEVKDTFNDLWKSRTGWER